MQNLLCFFLLFPLIINAQNAGTQKDNIIGSWTSHDTGYEMVIVFNADGTADLDGDAVKFRTEGNKLVVTSDGETQKYTFVLSDNMLTISGGDLESPLKFQRRGTQTKSPRPAPSGSKLQN